MPRRMSTRLTLILGTAAILAAAPLHATWNPASGQIGLKASVALADGGNDDGGNDDGSRGHGSDDHGSDDHGSSGHGNDDHAGNGSGSDDNGSDDSDFDGDGTTSGSVGDGTSGLTVVKFQSNSERIEVTYSDGTREEVTAGIYERKNADNRTVEERRATQADVDRLFALR